MSDAFFEKLFGDSQRGDFGTGWISGTASIFFGLLGFGGALCLHFPALLSLPDARAVYPMTIIRALIQGTIVLAIVLGAISGLLSERKVLAVTGASLGLLAAIIGGGSTPLPSEVPSKFGLGLDWFLLDLFVMTVVFLLAGTILAVASRTEDVRASMDHGPVLLRGHPLARPTHHAGDDHPGELCVRSGWRFRGWHTPSGACRFSSSCRWRLSSPISRNTPRTAPFTAFRSCGAFMPSITPLRRWIVVAGSRQHYVDILLTRGLILIPMTLFGFSQAALAGYLVFVSFHATFCHTDFRPRTIWLEPVLRDRALSPLAPRGASGGGGCQLRHPPPVHRSLVSALTIFPR